MAKPNADKGALAEISATNQKRYRLKTKDGKYLRLDGLGYIDKRVYAWIGNERQLLKMLAENEHAKGLIPVKVMPHQTQSTVFQ